MVTNALRALFLSFLLLLGFFYYYYFLFPISLFPFLSDFSCFPPRLDLDTLIRFTLTVRKGYRPVAYHNWAHAFSVAHSMCIVMKEAAGIFTWEEV